MLQFYSYEKDVYRLKQKEKEINPKVNGPNSGLYNWYSYLRGNYNGTHTDV